jgi:hypothetical protein
MAENLPLIIAIFRGRAYYCKTGAVFYSSSAAVRALLK